MLGLALGPARAGLSVYNCGNRQHVHWPFLLATLMKQELDACVAAAA